MITPIVEINDRLKEAKTEVMIEGYTLLFTPPLDEDYWLFRVPVSEKQAIVGFPKFLTIGIGFQHEEDWNTNLPYTCGAEEIYDHIKHNKGDKSISKGTCIAAICAIQELANQYMR